MGAGCEAGPPSLLSPVSLASGSQSCSGRRPGHVCLRRDRRAPQALSGGGHRRRWRGARQPQCAQRGRGDPEGDRRPAAGHAGRAGGGVRHGVAGGDAGGLWVRPAPGPPVAGQGDRFGPAEKRQGRRGDLGAAAARRSAAGGVDRPAGGPPAAGAAAAPGPAGAAADLAAQPDPRRAGRPRP